MNKIYYLKSCDKCRKILRVLNEMGVEITKQDIKSDAIKEEQLEGMRKKSGSYEALFSKSSRKYKLLEDKESLKEKDYKKLILSEYTFLKRPVILTNDDIFIGVNLKKMEEIRYLLK